MRAPWQAWLYGDEGPLSMDLSQNKRSDFQLPRGNHPVPTGLPLTNSLTSAAPPLFATPCGRRNPPRHERCKPVIPVKFTAYRELTFGTNHLLRAKYFTSFLANMSGIDNLGTLTQALGLDVAHFKEWLSKCIGLNKETVKLALQLCPDWESFIRLRDIKLFLKQLGDGKVPTVVNISTADSPNKKKKGRAADASASGEMHREKQTIMISIVLPALAIENLTAAHRFVRLVCVHTCRNELRGCDLSKDMLDVFKDEDERLKQMLENPAQFPRLTRGSDVITWLGRVRRWAARFPGCTGIPLAYLLRPLAVPGSLPPLKTDKPFFARPNSAHEGILTDLIQFTSQTGPYATEDGRTLYQQLDNALAGTGCHTTVLKHAKTQDGQKVFQEIEASVDHETQWEDRQETNQSKLDTYEPNPKKSLKDYFDVIDKVREQLTLCAENGYGKAPEDSVLVDRALKCIKDVFPKDLDLHLVITEVKSNRALKKDYAAVKAKLLAKDPNPASTMASGPGSRSGNARISAAAAGGNASPSSSRSNAVPDPVEGKTGVILHVDYSAQEAFQCLSSEQFKELNAKSAKGSLPSWKKVSIARKFVAHAKKSRRKESNHANKAKIAAAVAERTKTLENERDKFADGCVTLAKEAKRRRRKKRTKKDNKKNVSFGNVGSAVAGDKRRHESDSDSESSASDNSSDDGSVSSEDDADEPFAALISSARKIAQDKDPKRSKKSKHAKSRRGSKRQKTNHVKGSKKSRR